MVPMARYAPLAADVPGLEAAADCWSTEAQVLRTLSRCPLPRFVLKAFVAEKQGKTAAPAKNEIPKTSWLKTLDDFSTSKSRVISYISWFSDVLWFFEEPVQLRLLIWPDGRLEALAHGELSIGSTGCWDQNQWLEHVEFFFWWFGTWLLYAFMTFHVLDCIGNSNPNWLLYFSEGLKPPTRILFLVLKFSRLLDCPWVCAHHVQFLGDKSIKFASSAYSGNRWRVKLGMMKQLQLMWRPLCCGHLEFSSHTWTGGCPCFLCDNMWQCCSMFSSGRQVWSNCKGDGRRIPLRRTSTTCPSFEIRVLKMCDSEKLLLRSPKNGGDMGIPEISDSFINKSNRFSIGKCWWNHGHNRISIGFGPICWVFPKIFQPSSASQVDIDLMYSFGVKSGLPLQPRFRCVRQDGWSNFVPKNWPKMTETPG